MTVSQETLANWKRLSADRSQKLKARANKTRSGKTFIPRERGTSKASESLIADLLSMRARYSIEALLTFLCRTFLLRRLPSDSVSLKRFLREYPAERISLEVPDAVIEEADILGTVYQSLLSEGEKNIRGSYYTPLSTAQQLLDDLNLSEEDRFFDPCCGSGVFLLGALQKGASSVVGLDIDPIAVMISKTNLLLTFPESEQYPAVFVGNFLDPDVRRSLGILGAGPFTASASNPPWGADYPCSYGESASAFFFETLELLESAGRIHFLLPQALLTVKKHRPFRERVLSSCQTQLIREFKPIFTGVQTGFVSLLAAKGPQTGKSVIYHTDYGASIRVSPSAFGLTKQKAFRPISKHDEEILKRVRRKGELSLDGCRWGLGIVTGNNQKLLKKEQSSDTEPIYTGTEITPYVLKPAQRYIQFCPEHFQQCAPEALFRTAPKLVYRFIGNRLVFAPDPSGALFLNSANILIPEGIPLSFLALLGLLNSELFNYLHRVLFREIKVLRGNLSQLPLPKFSAKQDAELSALVRRVCAGAASPAEADEWIYRFYGLSQKEQTYIRQRFHLEKI